MKDWSKYLTEDIPEENTSIQQTEVLIEEAPFDKESPMTTQIPDDRMALSLGDARDFCERLSGRDEQGLSKSIITYQCYDSGFTPDETTDKNADVIYNCTKASAELSFDALNPTLALLTITFPTYDDPELRLFWARLQKWRRRDSGQETVSENAVPVFLVHLFERNSISVKTDIKETILEANIINPLICFLTRENPTMPASEFTNEKGEVMGGNVVKMLCNMEFVTFSILEDVDTSDIKAEALREAEADRYLTEDFIKTDTSSGFNLN